MAVLMTTVLGKICSFDAYQTEGSLGHKSSFFWGGPEKCKAYHIPMEWYFYVFLYQFFMMVWSLPFCIYLNTDFAVLLWSTCELINLSKAGSSLKQAGPGIASEMAFEKTSHIFLPENQRLEGPKMMGLGKGNSLEKWQFLVSIC